MVERVKLTNTPNTPKPTEADEQQSAREQHERVAALRQAVLPKALLETGSILLLPDDAEVPADCTNFIRERDYWRMLGKLARKAGNAKGGV